MFCIKKNNKKMYFILTNDDYSSLEKSLILRVVNWLLVRPLVNFSYTNNTLTLVSI